MKQSYRGQCNLHLYFAARFLDSVAQGEGDAWDGQFEKAMTEAAIWQLQLAYRAHLADMLTQQPSFPQSLPQGSYFARDFSAPELPPEIVELADREQHTPWLASLIGETFLTTPQDESAQEAPQLIARQSDASDVRDLDELRDWHRELASLIDRQRATLLEY